MDNNYPTALLNIAGAIVAALIGAIATLWAVRLQRPKKIIRVSSNNTTILNASRSNNLPGNLKVFYEEAEIKKLISARILIRNVSQACISEVPFRWEIHSEGVILDSPQDTVSNINPFSPLVITRPSEYQKIIEGTLRFINPGEVVSISTISTGDITKSEFDSRAPDLTIKSFVGLDIYTGYTFADSLASFGIARLAALFGGIGGVLAVILAVWLELNPEGLKWLP